MKIQDKFGVTLVELVVVMTILAILVLLAAPAMTDILPNLRLRSAAYDIVASIQRARAVAVEQNRDIVVSINSVSRTITFPYDVNTAPKIVSLADFANTSFGIGKATEDWSGSSSMNQATAITFNGRGLASGAGGNMTIYLDNGEDGIKNQLCYGIRVLTTGFVQMRKFIPCSIIKKNGTVEENGESCWVD